MPGIKEEGAEEEDRLFGGQMSADLQSTPLSYHDGTAVGQGWNLKSSKGGIAKSEGRRKGEGGSDSDSDSGSSSSERSGSSDESGESEEEGDGGKLAVGEKKSNPSKMNATNCYFSFFYV